jgi:hypothetical protein
MNHIKNKFGLWDELHTKVPVLFDSSYVMDWITQDPLLQCIRYEVASQLFWNLLNEQ